MNPNRIAAGLALFLTLSAGSCDDSNSQQHDQQEVMLQQATNAVGMPAVINFQERRTLKAVLELRDQSISTVTYITDLNGHLHKVCDSIGYGIPYATQYTNPSYVDMRGRILPQADPNGLFSPAAAEGTWVTCLDPVKKQSAVVYIEPRIVVSPFALAVN